MSATLDATHSPGLESWVVSAIGHPDFPIQNLPLGIFSPKGQAKRAGVAIGDEIVDLAAALTAGLFEGEARRAAEAASAESLNAFLALGPAPRRALRTRLSAILAAGSPDRDEPSRCCTAPRNASCTCRKRGRLHGLLRRHPPRDECRAAVPAR
jgi:fumarylacetoacetase